jgi:cytochrome P450
MRPLAQDVHDWITLAPSPLRDDPAPLYHRLLEEEPVHKATTGAWLLVRRADVDASGRHQSLSRETAPYGVQKQAGPPSPFAALTHGNLEFRDPPVHTRLRTLAQQPFSARNVAAWRPRLRALVNERLDAVVDKGEMDLVADYSMPFPVDVITALLGLPRELTGILDEVTQVLLRLFIPGTKPPEVMAWADEVAVRFVAAMRDVVEHRRQHPADDLLSLLIEARDGSDRLNDDELIATCMLLHVAGHETTGNLIANAVLTLLRHPDQLADLRADPALLRPAIEEVLRYEPSAITAAPATTVEPVEFSGVTIPAGEVVQPLTAAANRDPRAFEEPDRFDIRRAPNKHIAFYSGTHFCMGATLSRVESEEALGALLQRLPDLELAVESAPWRKVWSIRALEALPVRWTPS